MKPAMPSQLPRETKPRRSGGRLAVRIAAGPTVALALFLLSFPLTGCFGLLLVGGAGTSAVAFATGELRSTEATALAELDAACASAVDVLGYDEVETDRDADHIRWRARTASGDPVDIRLSARTEDSTELRIRIGVFGDEAKSRLVLEQIHQSLAHRR